jgi:hypothetical protein
MVFPWEAKKDIRPPRRFKAFRTVFSAEFRTADKQPGSAKPQSKKEYDQNNLGQNNSDPFSSPSISIIRLISDQTARFDHAGSGY